ncbi:MULTISPECIES: serine/threonine protein kinase [unclassified Corallococcus]|uniref:serine/threonine protein kinase n=1 Tax=unclassified Corallococcus TaxID=2685029 RepID=UPI001A8D3187|nr:MULTISPECIES: serine/threonine-protein kinase [unclassified Corallococcus]MBN9685461.1 protein kinase [Corallococcus sp. NCSPR001]WAS83091.1 protein kinase [Corallococcus sp. NCRR]
MSGTYRLIGRTEAGDLAELYESLLLPSIPVAVKLFLPRTSDPAYARSLAETVRLLQPVRHPGLLHVVDVGFVRQRLAVVREDVDGFTLGVALQRLNTKEVLLPPTVALSIVIQLLETVQLAHDAGAVHGAITPGNVLLSRDGFPAICDFGALQALLSVPQLKRTFAHRGRSAYRAPEVTRGDPPTEASDVYSLGAIAYELLTLREAVVPGSGVSTRRETLPPPSRLDRRINSRLDPAIMRALDPAPQRRFRSCGEFAQALRNFLSAGGGLPGAEEVARFVSELFPNEVSLAVPGPVPFAEPFQLEPVSGAEMDDLHAEELEASIVQRAPYSRAPTEQEASAETQEAAPGFEAFRPEDYAPDDDAPLDDEPGPEGEPRSTELSPAGPLEQGWDAPPGVLAQKARRPDSPASARAGRNPRVKVIEDFSGPPLGDDEPPVPTGRRAAMRPGPALGDDEPPVPTGRRAAMRPGGAEEEPAKRPALRPAKGAGGRAPGQETAILPAGGGVPAAAERRGRAEPTEALPAEPRSERRMAPPKAEGRVRSDMAVPAPSDRHLPVHQRFDTVETPRMSAVDAGTRRKRLLFIAGGIALVGLFMFAVAAWRLGLEPVKEPELPRYDPNAPAPPANPSALKPIAPPPPAPPPNPGARDIEDEDADEDAAEPGVPPKNQRAFLTLRTNLPANVFIDGAKVRRATPLLNYPVRVGTRDIRVVAISTGEQKDFQLRFSRGQHQKLEEQFQPPPTRR